MVKKCAKKISNTVKGVTNSAINKIKEYTLQKEGETTENTTKASTTQTTTTE